MLTFDSNLYSDYDDPLKELVKRNLPDLMEVGETNEYWVFVNRKSKKIELLSKQTGETVVTCGFDEAPQFGVHPMVIRVAQDALVL